MKEHLDGWDLGILIRMGQRNMIRQPLYHSMVRSELISEVGWMDQEEIDQRLERLKELDLIKDVAQATEPAYWADELCRRCGKGCDETSWNKQVGRYRILDSSAKVEVMLSLGLYCEEVL